MNNIENVSDIDDQEFWLSASEESLDAIWGNEEDDVYAKLLEQIPNKVKRNHSVSEDVV